MGISNFGFFFWGDSQLPTFFVEIAPPNNRIVQDRTSDHNSMSTTEHSGSTAVAHDFHHVALIRHGRNKHQPPEGEPSVGASFFLYHLEAASGTGGGGDADKGGLPHSLLPLVV